MLFSHVFFCISSILKIYIPSMFATFFFVTWNPQKCQRSSEIIVGPPLDLALRSGRRQADFLDLKDPGSHLSREGRHFIVEGPEVGDAIMAHIHQNLSVLFPNLDVNYMCIWIMNVYDILERQSREPNIPVILKALDSMVTHPSRPSACCWPADLCPGLGWVDLGAYMGLPLQPRDLMFRLVCFDVWGPFWVIGCGLKCGLLHIYYM